jgi:transposase
LTAALTHAPGRAIGASAWSQSSIPSNRPIDQWLASEPRLQATRIHQDLVRDYGFTGSYPTVQRYVDRARPRKPEPVSELPLYGFHMVLGHSRDTFVGLVDSQDLVTLWACHRAAFHHFGGVPAEILYDRTKTVIHSHVGHERRQGERL